MRTPDPKQRWLTFVRNHAKVMVACDFFVVITATFRTLYVFVVIEIDLHQNVTAPPTAEWTLQQFREALPGDHPYRFLIHDRDSIFGRKSTKVSRTSCRSRVPPNQHRHSLPIGYRMVKRSVLGGLHHEYGLAKEAA